MCGLLQIFHNHAVYIFCLLLYFEGIPFEADGFNNSAIQGKYSVSQESSFSFLHLTSPVTVESVKRNYNQPKIDDLNKSLGELNIGLQQMPTFQPHHSSNTMHIPGVNSARFQSFVNNEDGKLKFELRTGIIISPLFLLFCSIWSIRE